MRIVYYTHSAFFELALSLVRALSRHAQVDLLLEVSPGAWRSAGFDVPPQALPAGIIPADPVLAPLFPSGVRDYWRAASSFQLVVHGTKGSFTPASFRLGRAVLRAVADLSPDVLHVDDVDVSPRLALSLRGARHPPIALAVHDPQPHSGEGNWRRSIARRLAYPTVTRFVLYNEVLRDGFSKRFHISPGVIDTARLGPYDVFREWAPRPGSTDGRPIVLFFGRLSPYKGLDTFYAAAPLIAQRVGDVRMIVAGRPIEGYSPPRAPTLSAGATIEVVERYLSNEDVAGLCARARIIVCPYRDATQSGVVLTAFAFGVPVVASAVGGLVEYVEHGRTGLVVPPGDVPALADAVGQLLIDQSLHARIRDGIRDAAGGELNWNHTVESLLRTYAECRLQRRPRRRN